MAKYPAAGKVKTRLIPWLSPDDATELAMAFLAETSATVGRIDGLFGYLAVLPGEFAGRLALEVGPGLHPLSQTGSDLGERISAVMRGLQAPGVRTLVIGADTPHLTVDVLEGAFRMLDEQEMVIGPACDGGFYLIGSRIALPDLFIDIEWGCGDVYSRTLHAGRRLGLKIGILPKLFDIDTLSDLRRLRQDEAWRSLSPRTRTVAERCLASIEMANVGR